MAGMKSKDSYVQYTETKNHRDLMEGRLQDLSGAVSRLSDRVTWLEDRLALVGVNRLGESVEMTAPGRWRDTSNPRRSPFLAST